MKLRLSIFALFALLSFVAYQKYSEYSSLRSIDSYERCVAAKGSVIQESYPATCITRLSIHFTHKQTFNKYINQNYLYSIDYPSDWKMEDHAQNITFTKDNSLSTQGFEAIISVSDTGMTKASATPKTFINPGEKTDMAKVDKKTALQIINDRTISIIFLDNSNRYLMIRLESANLPNYTELFNQILSTFKFTN